VTEPEVLWWTGTINVLAIIAAPIAALWLQRNRDQKQALENRREQVFKALWVNRRRPFYLARVDALNMIDLEFFGEQKVLDAWADLFAHYVNKHPGLNENQVVQEREDKFATLLYEMSQVVRYKFGKTHIRDNVYRPELHNKFDEIEFETRNRILDLLKTDALPVRFVAPVPPDNSSKS
jgi:hypothetical protein